MKGTITRYIVTANGEAVHSTFDERKAYIYAGHYIEQCLNEDEPQFPKMEVVAETLKEEKEEQ